MTAARGVIVIEDSLAVSPLLLLQPTISAARAVMAGIRDILRRPLPALRKNSDRLTQTESLLQSLNLLGRDQQSGHPIQHR